jgi:hypothetical protein
MVELQSPAPKEDPVGERLMRALTVCGALTALGVGFMFAKWSLLTTCVGWALSWISAGLIIYLYRIHLAEIFRGRVSVHQPICILMATISISTPPYLFFSDPTLRHYQLLQNISGAWGDADCANTISISVSPTAVTITPLKFPPGAQAKPIFARVTAVGDMTLSTQDVSQSANGASPGALFTLHDNGRVRTLEWDDFRGPPRTLNHC